MGHAVHTRDLGRNRSWRKATVRSLAQALLTREQIRTTWPKAKEAQRLTERLITLGKENTLSARRRALSILADPAVVKRLFSEVAPRYGSRQGGYTRVLHNGTRAGDAAAMAVLELVERSPKPEKVSGTFSPEAVKKAPDPGAAEPKKTAEKKPPSFVEGLRKFFFRGRDNPR